TNMAGPRVGKHTFCRAGLRAEHQIVIAEIKLLQSQRIKRQHVAVPSPATRNFLQERSLDRTFAKNWVKFSWINHQREEVGLRKHFRHRLHDALAASAMDEPVVNDCDLQFLQ